MAEEIKNEEQVQEETKTEEKKPKTKKEKSSEVEVPKHLKSLVEEIEQMKLIDLAELVKVLEEKFGVSATPVAVAAAAPTDAPAEEGKSLFNVVITAAGDKKIEVIKVVKELTEKGLKDCKDIVDAVDAGPQVIKENAKKEEAEKIKAKLETAGATVELK